MTSLALTVTTLGDGALMFEAVFQDGVRTWAHAHDTPPAMSPPEQNNPAAMLCWLTAEMVSRVKSIDRIQYVPVTVA